MARRKHNTGEKQRDRLDAIRRHALAMDLRSIDAYRTWCREQGFRAGLNKTDGQLRQERQHHRSLLTAQKLVQHKREGNRRHFIRQIYTNEIRQADLGGEIMLTISNGFRTSRHRAVLRSALLQLEECSKLLERVEHVRGVINLVAYAHMWLRPIAEWLPRTHNADRQFSSLARHLFCRYEIPAFMDGVWLHGSGQAQGWYMHLGLGKNIRSAAGLPVPLTRRMAHHFVQAPSHYDVNAAFRWAQVHTLGGNRRIADAVAETRMAQFFEDDAFWLSVLRFFIDNPMLDVGQYGPIVDYIWHKRFENRLVFIDRGVAQEAGPEQPNFSMHGRDAHTLLRQVERWHRGLNRALSGVGLQWEKSRFRDFRYKEGQDHSRNRKLWTIRELLSSNELAAEGQAQRHCVASYARSCFSGATSIWTMDLKETQVLQKKVTIEVHNSTKTIRQVRGLRNRLATGGEMEVLRRWADAEGLALSSYLRYEI